LGSLLELSLNSHEASPSFVGSFFDITLLFHEASSSYGSTVAIGVRECRLFCDRAWCDGRQVIYRDDTDRRRFLDLFGREVEEQAGLLVLRLWFNE